MLVFIDESGDPGFKMARGSDPIFAVGMVIFKTITHADKTQSAIGGLHKTLRHKPEFKFCKCNDAVKDGFCKAVVDLPFSVRALVVQKELIYSPALRTNNDAFYNYFVKQLMNYDAGMLKGAKVRIDGSGDRQFQRSFCAYLKRELHDKISDARLVDSDRDPLMQLADMCIGAIARAYRKRDDPARWLEMLRPRIDNIWQYR